MGNKVGRGLIFAGTIERGKNQGQTWLLFQKRNFRSTPSVRRAARAEEGRILCLRGGMDG